MEDKDIGKQNLNLRLRVLFCFVLLRRFIWSITMRINISIYLTPSVFNSLWWVPTYPSPPSQDLLKDWQFKSQERSHAMKFVYQSTCFLFHTHRGPSDGLLRPGRDGVTVKFRTGKRNYIDRLRSDDWWSWFECTPMVYLVLRLNNYP